ncbi:hypothetical protein T4B_586 [Trichinella pseudospiralis]|uniref:Uncharacterized protein n=1 Tax=Trichinella pseudospiralis TaxID=6337 RepID=A0A0V1EYN2_TRIPS|nr:hypothetical protein T4A_2049 [Trichinella pseudospiralis]KRZ24443.1 hypothetical protein T4B_586 [Trichinella pseudospiralis]KRZ46389.1 hypothetical protein T4C_8294 [Trichinella pseudospiralis]
MDEKEEEEKQEKKQEEKNEKKLSSEDENANSSSTGEAAACEKIEKSTDQEKMSKKPPDTIAATENNIYSEEQIMLSAAKNERTLSSADEETYRPTRFHWDSNVSWPIEMMWQQQANDTEMENAPLIRHLNMEQESDALKKLKAAVAKQCTTRATIIFDHNLIQQWLSAYKQSWPFKSNVMKKPKKYFNKKAINYEILDSCVSSSLSSVFPTQVERFNKRKPTDQYLKSSSFNVQHPVKLNAVYFLEPSHCKVLVNEFRDKNDKKWIRNMLINALNNKSNKKMGKLQCEQFEKLEFFDCTLQLLAFIFDFALQLGKQILNNIHCNDEIKVNEKLTQLLVTSFKHSVDQLQFENDSQFDWKVLISQCIDEAELQNCFGQTATPFHIQLSEHLLRAFQNLCYYTICTLLLVPSAIPKVKMQKSTTEAVLPNLIFSKGASYVVHTVGLDKRKLIRVKKGEAKLLKAEKAETTTDKEQYFILFDDEKDHGSGVCFSCDKEGGDKALQAFTAVHRSKVLKPLYSDWTVSMQWLSTPDLFSDVHVINSSQCFYQTSKQENKNEKIIVTQQQNMNLQKQLATGGEKQTADVRQDAFYAVGLGLLENSALEKSSQETNREEIDADELTTDEIVDEFLVALFNMPAMQLPCQRCLSRKPYCKRCYYINKYLPQVTKK